MTVIKLTFKGLHSLMTMELLARFYEERGYRVEPSLTRDPKTNTVVYKITAVRD